MKPMYSGNRKKLVVVIYTVDFILSIQLFQRGYVQNGGQGINKEIQIFRQGKVTYLGHLVRPWTLPQQFLVGTIVRGFWREQHGGEVTDFIVRQAQHYCRLLSQVPYNKSPVIEGNCKQAGSRRER